MRKKLKDFRIVFVSMTLIMLISCGNIVFKNGIPHNLNSFYHGKMERKMAVAIAHNDVKAIEELAKSGVDTSSVGKDGLSFLMLAFSLYKYEAFCKLLELGADVNFRPVNGPGVFTRCLWSKDSRYLKKILEYPVDVNYEEKNRQRAIFTAISKATTNENFRILLDRKDLDINIPTHPPFYSALVTCNYDKALILLEYGADPFKDEHLRNRVIEKIEESQVIKDGPNEKPREELINYIRQKYNIKLNMKYPDPIEFK